MDSTPTTPQFQDPSPISIKPSPRKLPIKRKTPDSFSNPTLNLHFVSTKLESTLDENHVDAKPPPFKFHRLWTEPDEIRFLRGLRDCAPQGLSFPRDLHVFYDRFSNTMSQPYSKSQLSEKLRRLRKKFRILSSRLARGLNSSMLSPHDRALYELAAKLWSPEFSSTSPFGNNSSGFGSKEKEEKNKSENNLIGIKASFLLTLPTFCSHSNQNVHVNEFANVGHCEEVIFGHQSSSLASGGIGRVAAETVLDVFDRCLKEIRTVLVRQGFLYPDGNKSSKVPDFDTRWQLQRVAELNILARRLRAHSAGKIELVRESTLGSSSAGPILHLIYSVNQRLTVYGNKGSTDQHADINGKEQDFECWWFMNWNVNLLPVYELEMLDRNMLVESECWIETYYILDVGELWAVAWPLYYRLILQKVAEVGILGCGLSCVL